MDEEGIRVLEAALNPQHLDSRGKSYFPLCAPSLLSFQQFNIGLSDRMILRLNANDYLPVYRTASTTLVRSRFYSKPLPDPVARSSPDDSSIAPSQFASNITLPLTATVPNGTDNSYTDHLTEHYNDPVSPHPNI
jgi:hypothetical protein